MELSNTTLCIVQLSQLISYLLTFGATLVDTLSSGARWFESDLDNTYNSFFFVYQILAIVYWIKSCSKPQSSTKINLKGEMSMSSFLGWCTKFLDKIKLWMYMRTSITTIMDFFVQPSISCWHHEDLIYHSLAHIFWKIIHKSILTLAVCF